MAKRKSNEKDALALLLDQIDLHGLTQEDVFGQNGLVKTLTAIRRFIVLIIDPEIIQILLEVILGAKAGIRQISFFAVPLMQFAIVKQLHIVTDDEGDNAVTQALLKHNEPSDAPVAVLKRVDRLKADMKADDVLQCLSFDRIILGQKRAHHGGHFLRRRGFSAAHFIWHSLVISHCDPAAPRIAGAALQYKM